MICIKYTVGGVGHNSHLHHIHMELDIVSVPDLATEKKIECYCGGDEEERKRLRERRMETRSKIQCMLISRVSVRHTACYITQIVVR